MFQAIRKLLLREKYRVLPQKRQPIWNISETSCPTNSVPMSQRLRNTILVNYNTVHNLNHSATEIKYQ
jgi:hypothetical protein